MNKFAILLAVTACSGASLLQQRIDEILRTSKPLAPATLGIEIIQVRSGKVLYTRNADKLFTPASNTKLFSTALALTRLGPDYRLATRVFVAAGPDIDGKVDGDLVLWGSGDPSMSDLAVPYNRKEEPANPMAAIEELANQIVAKGVREIRGNIVGDSTAWPWEPTPPGWGVDDPVWEHGAPVSALSFNNGRLRMTIVPGEAEGAQAAIDVVPALEYYALANNLVTGDTKVHQILAGRPLGSRELRFNGTVSLSAKPLEEELAVDDPPLFAAIALRDALVRRGIAVHGEPVSKHREIRGEGPSQPTGRMIAGRQSAPLAELIQVVNKISQNLWAEMIFRATASARRGDGARRLALEELKAFLSEIGVPDDSYSFEDGSGLSRMGLVSPLAVNRLLRFMYLGPNAEVWKASLPVGGVDGTLEKRFAKNPAASAISAKTGSLSHVNALSGYAESATYGEVAFSVIVNHTIAPAADVRAAVDQIALAILD